MQNFSKYSKRKLILISDKLGFQRTTDKESYSWFFFSRDYEHLLKLKKIAPVEYHFIDTGDFLSASANRLRQPYLDYIGSLSQRFSSLSWWTSRIAEKNVMSSPLFLYLCYLDVFVNVLQGDLDKNNNENICIFSESPVLLNIFYHLSISKSYKIFRFYNRHKLEWFFVAFVRIISFYLLGIKHKFWSTITKKKTSKFKKPLTILRTWVSENDFGNDGTFKDSYFLNLKDYLIQQGKTVVIWPMLYNTKRPFKKAIKWFRQNKDLFLIPEDYYRAIDYFKSTVTCFNIFNLFKHKFIFNNLDVTLLFKEETWRSFFEPGMPEIIMHYFLAKRMKNMHIKIDKFIITFENMFHEKPLLLGLAEFYPGTESIGFQHSVLYPLLLSLYISGKEYKIIPMPDKIICSGKFFKQTLISEGYPENKLVCGPALRFQYLWQPYNKNNDQSENIALIAFPLTKSSALELMSKVWPILIKKPGIKVWLKAHPLMASSQLAEIMRKFSGASALIKVVDGPIKNILPKIRFAITTASGIVLDMIALGLPVIRVRQDLDLNLDPMDWFPLDEMQFVARTSKQIEEEIQRILSLEEKQFQQLRDYGKNMIEKCFYPVTEETLASFIK